MDSPCPECDDFHPTDVGCAEWRRAKGEEGDPEIDARIAAEEAEKKRNAPLTGYQRVKRWRQKNPEAHREYMRKYMAERRAKGL